MEQQEIAKPEQEHARGYESRPQTADEIGEWEVGQVWNSYEPEETK
jgi:hypothetical protein